MKKLLFIFICLLAGSVMAQTPDSFSISIVTADIDCAEISSFDDTRNAGALNDFTLGDNFIPQTRIRHGLFNFPTLADSMIAVGAATWDSAKIRIFSKVPQIETAETLFVFIHKMTSLWDEGDATSQADFAGVRWDSASASGSGGGGGKPNAPLAWASEPDFGTDDYSATAEAQLSGDSVIFAGGDVGDNTEYYIRIGSATISDTLGEGIVFLVERISTGDNECYIEFDSDDAATAADRPWLEVFYTTGAPPAAKPQIIFIEPRNIYDKNKFGYLGRYCGD